MSSSVTRLEVYIQGLVQGVGMRPFIWNIASKYGLTGFVCNEIGAVRCEIQGDADSVDRFLRDIRGAPPTRARVDEITVRTLPNRFEASFLIIESSSRRSTKLPLVLPDIATCDDCRRELFDPANRRYRHPFITCTQCGPRLTIATRAPWDRCNTTMAEFDLCSVCDAEYRSPRSRRYHAETISCHDCGPKLKLTVIDENYARRDTDECLDLAARMLVAGAVLAIKGVGGFHLVCRADSDTTVSRLRQIKKRPAQPFALMVANAGTVARYGVIDKSMFHSLSGWQAPIVLMPMLPDARREIGRLVAPGLNRLGFMTPYSPVYHLLFDELDGLMDCLVVTSANRSGSPMISDARDEMQALSLLCDAILDHDRHIAQPIDDSVIMGPVSGSGSSATVVRLGRGLLPLEISLPVEAQSCSVALGGDQKCVLAIGHGNQAVAAARIGTLLRDSHASRLDDALVAFGRLYQRAPDRILADLHPDYVSHRWAQRVDIAPITHIQHHVAHVAAVLAEHPQPPGTVIGVAFDGFGYGCDGVMRGGELMLVDVDASGMISPRWVGSLKRFLVPRTDQIARRPSWAAFCLLAALDGKSPQPDEVGLSRIEADALTAMLKSPRRAISSTSVGRVFDSVAALLDICRVASYEAQAPVELEAIADESNAAAPYGSSVVSDGRTIAIDLTTCIYQIRRDIAESTPASTIARRFHLTIAHAMVAACESLRTTYSLPTSTPVAMGGGVFVNQLLRVSAASGLRRKGFIPLLNAKIPPNDEGLAFGQLLAVGTV